jgi:predicted glutamine amidotransferase
MCGLFGWLEKRPGAIPGHKKTILTDALGFKSETRGTDSWGSMVVFKDGKGQPWYRVHKGLGAYHKHNRKLFKHDIRSRASLVMGHTRMKTHGEAKTHNAHPFEAGNFIMAHNGVLSRMEYLKGTALLPKGETDSEAFLCWVVSRKKGLEGFLETNTLANAFEVYDKQTGDLHIVTRGRDVFAINTPDLVVWSSEAQITETAYDMAFKKELGAQALTDNSITKISAAGVETIMTSQTSISFSYGEHDDPHDLYSRSYYKKWEAGYYEKQPDNTTTGQDGYWDSQGKFHWYKD